MPTDTAISIGLNVMPAAVSARPAGARKPFLDAYGINERATAQDANYVRRMLAEAGATGPDIVLHVDPHKAASSYDGVPMAAVAEALAAWGAAPAAPPGVVFSGGIAGAHGGGLRFSAADSTLPALFALAERGDTTVAVVGDDAAWMGSYVPELDVRTCTGVAALQRALAHPAGVRSLPMARDAWAALRPPPSPYLDTAHVPELAWPFAIAAAGGHNLAVVSRVVGDPRAATALAGILPPLTTKESREVLSMNALAGSLQRGAPEDVRRPFRAPHESVEDLSGAPGRPGELALANLGVLAVGDLSLVKGGAMDAIAQAVADGHTSTVRAEWRIDWPAEFLLVAMTPRCTCTYASCDCTPERLASHRKRTMPRLERICQITVHVANTRPDATPSGTASSVLRAVVAQARAIAMARQGKLNGALTLPETLRLAPGIGAPGHVLRIARTLADLAGGGPITRAEVDEARALDVARALDAR